MDTFTKAVLFVAGASWGITYAAYRRPIPVTCTPAGKPVTQVYSQKMLRACAAVEQIRPMLEPIAEGQSPTLADVYSLLR
jgi:hypothetical protein